MITMMPMPRTMPPMNDPALNPDMLLQEAGVDAGTTAVVSRLVLVSAGCNVTGGFNVVDAFVVVLNVTCAVGVDIVIG